MRPRNRLARLFRALSGETQKDFAGRTGVDLSLLARYELDQVEPGLDHLAKLAEGAGLTLAAGEQVLRLADTLSNPRRRAGAGIEDLGPELSALLAGTYQRFLRLAPPADPPRAEDREHANDLGAAGAASGGRATRGGTGGPGVPEPGAARRVCQESLAASRESGRSASLARLAQEIAARVPGPEEWRTGTDISSLLDRRLLDPDSGL